MPKVDYSEFVSPSKGANIQSIFVRADLTTTDKDELYVVGSVVVDGDKKTFYLKRCVGDHFFNPLDYQKGGRSDIAYSDYVFKPKWWKVSSECYKRYIEFLETKSRLALAQAEREYTSI